MATSHPLNATTRARTGSGKLNQLRAEGLIPAVLYGAGTDNKNLKVNAREFTSLLASAISEHILIDLTIDGAKAPERALLKDIQHDYLKGTILHIDLLKVEDTTVVSAPVPIIIEGEPVGVKQGGLLDQLVHDLEVKCMCKDLPEEIKIDVTKLSVGQTITIKELNLPEGVTPVLNGDVIIVLVSETRASISDKS